MSKSELQMKSLWHEWCLYMASEVNEDEHNAKNKLGESKANKRKMNKMSPNDQMPSYNEDVAYIYTKTTRTLLIVLIGTYAYAY